jgi:hypothetical protein
MYDCRAFLFFLGARPLYRDKILSSKELLQPRCPDESGYFDAGYSNTGGQLRCWGVFSKNKLSQQPDIILVKADATARNLPSNLKAFKCPRVLLVGIRTTWLRRFRSLWLMRSRKNLTALFSTTRDITRGGFLRLG